MKKIIIANAQVPFVYGGAEYLAEWLQKKIVEYGYKAELVKIPFKWYPPERIPEHILACRLLDLTQTLGDDIDVLIGLKFPAYHIKHPNKVLWLFHQFREVYDLWGTKYQGVPDTPEGRSAREIVIHSDNSFLKEARKIFTISKVVTERLRAYNGIDSTPLYPPLENPERFYCGEFSNYIFYPSRISTIKRQCLAIESMKFTGSRTQLIIAGTPDSPNYMKYLHELIEKNNLRGRVKVIGKISQDEKIKLFAEAVATLFIPYDEDYGFVTLESFYSRKPVITCADSGGPLEFVENGVNGYIVPPEPKAIASAIDEICSNKEKAKEMGKAGYDKLLSLNISWDNLIEVLIE
jgi:glycosyltransferase involved in cell wall biosynthesis